MKYNEVNHETNKPLIGLLALQGAYEAHGKVCERLGYKTHYVKTQDDLSGIDRLIIPGGESTTFLKLFEYKDLRDELKRRIAEGIPVLATCAGLILLAGNLTRNNQETLGILDVEVERNAYGRQVDSFEAELKIPRLGDNPFPGIFIRAPVMRSVGNRAEVLASWKERPVLIQQGRILAATFHPELSGDDRIHEYFLSM